MANENLISTLEQRLRETRTARNRLAQRLAELEDEAATLRNEIAEMDTLAAQAEQAIVRLLSSVLSAGGTSRTGAATDDEIEEAMRRDEASGALPRTPLSLPRRVPALRDGRTAQSNRFSDRTIPQAATILLREAGTPLHVNEIYNRLIEGGFSFSGHNPTISIAVSLNRNGRFRKVAPGTFELMIRDASRALS